MDGYFQISIADTFLQNAGLLGFYRALKYYGAIDGKDYKIDGSSFFISKDYIVGIDISDLYVKSMLKFLGQDTRFEAVLSKAPEEERLFENIQNLDKEEIKKLENYYKSMSEMLDKASFKAGINILNDLDNKEITSHLVSLFKKEKNPQKKHEYYFKICEALKDQQVDEVFRMKDIIYSKISLFYQGGKTYYFNMHTKENVNDYFLKDFGQPFVNEVTGENKAKFRCIDCGNKASQKVSMSFMLDTTDDVARKKSHYWNCKPDAFICPVCAFLYMFVPVGFHFCGNSAIFVNDNSGLEEMKNMMDQYLSRHIEIENENAFSIKSKMFRIFTTEAIHMLEGRMNCLQVYVRMSKNDHYEMTIINEDIIKKLRDSRGFLEKLERQKSFKDGDAYFNVYDDVMECILQRKSLYPLIRRQLMYNLSEKDKRNPNYIKNILDIQMKCYGGDKMVEMEEKTKQAFMSGISMREVVTKGIMEKDKDNTLRGLVYKLENQVSVNNVKLFLDTIIRLYAGAGIPIPPVFKECYNAEELFGAIGQAYILGLKYQKYEKAND